MTLPDTLIIGKKTEPGTEAKKSQVYTGSLFPVVVCQGEVEMLMSCVDDT